MSFTFMFGGNVLANPHPERLSPLVACSELLQMLMVRKSSEVHLYEFSIDSFHCLVDALNPNGELLFSDDIISLIELCDFFMIPSINVLMILPKYGLDNLEMNVKAKILHTLHHYNYKDLTSTMLFKLRMDPCLLIDLPLSWAKFKKRVRDVNRLENWLKVRVIPMCTCPQCTLYRHERLLQLLPDGDPYPTPYHGLFHNTIF